MKKEGFDNIPMDEVRDMVGFVEPTENADTWEVTCCDGCGFTCESQENAHIMAGIEELKAKLFA